MYLRHIPILVIAFFIVLFACNDRELVPDTTSSQLVASFSIENDSCTAPCEVRFLNNSLGASSFSWNFGDGNSSELVNPEHRYESGGTFSVKLTAFSNNNIFADTTKSVFIRSASPEVVIARFTFENDSCIAPCTVSFDASNSQNADSYIWDFGDGNTDTGSAVSHEFETSGEYSVKLIVSADSENDTSTQTILILDQPVNPAPTLRACFTIDSISNNGFAPATVFLSNCSEGATSFSWSWGDGSEASTEEAGSHTFDQAGEYEIKLTAQDIDRNLDDTSIVINILAPNTFEQTLGGPQREDAESLIITESGDYAILGNTFSQGSGGSDFWLIMLNENGNVIWDRTYGGTSGDFANDIIQTSDGGFALLGETQSKGEGRADFWLVKTDIDGNVLWDKTYGDSRTNAGFSLIQTFDGGFGLLGVTAQQDTGASIFDFHFIKTDHLGNTIFERIYGGVESDFARSIVQTTDGGFILFGQTESRGAGQRDFWLIKTNTIGNVLWDNTYGGGQDEFAFKLIPLREGGFGLFGSTESQGAGNFDMYLIVTDENGNIIFSNTYGGISFDSGRSIVQTSNEEFTVIGITTSKGQGENDYWLVHTDKSGDLEWDRTFGGTEDDSGINVKQASDGGYIISGITQSKGLGDDDIWLIKTDSEGNVN